MEHVSWGQSKLDESAYPDKAKNTEIYIKLEDSVVSYNAVNPYSFQNVFIVFH